MVLIKHFAKAGCFLSGTKASILIETGFMTNRIEAELMKTEAFCRECAEEAARGVCKYAGIKHVPPKGAEGDDEVIDKVKIIYKGLEIEVERILKDGTNYIRLRDLEDKLGICKVGYDEQKKIPVIEKI